MTIGIISGTGYAARTVAQKIRGAAGTSTLPLWRQNQIATAPRTWKRFDQTALESIAPQTWCTATIAQSYSLSADQKYRLNNTGANAYPPSFISEIITQSQAALRQLGSHVIAHGGGHQASIATNVISAQINVLGDDAIGSQVRWVERMPSSDYASAIGPIGGTYNPAPSYLLNNAGSIDIYSNYAFETGNTATQHFINPYTGSFTPRSALQPWMRDGKPSAGHEGYGNWFNDADDAMWNIHQGGAHPTGGAARINKLSWNNGSPTWNVKINQSVIDPLDAVPTGTGTFNVGSNAWESPYGDWAKITTPPTTGFFFNAAAMDPATGDFYRMASSNRFHKWSHANGTQAGMSVTLMTVSQGTNASFPALVVPTVNKLFYFDPTSAIGVLTNFTLRSWDLATQVASSTFLLTGNGVDPATHLSRQAQGAPQEGAFYAPAPIDRIVYVPIDLHIYGIWLINYTTGAKFNFMPGSDARVGGAPGRQSTPGGVREGTMRCGWSNELGGMWFVSAAKHSTADLTDPNNGVFYPALPQDARGTIWFLDFTNITLP